MDIVHHGVATSPFEAIRLTGEHGDWWSARDLMPLLGYDSWRRFEETIERARVAAQNSGISAGEFVQVSQVVDAGNLGPRNRMDYRLSRYACYLVAMNGDPRKPEIAAAQTYFAVKTREAEIGASAPAQRRPLVPLTVLRDMVEQLIEHEQAIEAAQDTANRAHELGERNEARLDAIEGRHGWLAALGFARCNGLPTDRGSLAALGRLASKVAETAGIEPCKVEHELYGKVNSYPEWVWREAVERRRALP